MFLNERNIVITRLFKKLNNKMLKSFKVINFISFFYKLKLLGTMRIHDMFHLNLPLITYYLIKRMNFEN